MNLLLMLDVLQASEAGVNVLVDFEFKSETQNVSKYYPYMKDAKQGMLYVADTHVKLSFLKCDPEEGLALIKLNKHLDLPEILKAKPKFCKILMTLNAPEDVLAELMK